MRERDLIDQDIQRLVRMKFSAERLAAIEFAVCPRCMQSVKAERRLRTPVAYVSSQILCLALMAKRNQKHTSKINFVTKQRSWKRKSSVSPHLTMIFCA